MKSPYLPIKSAPSNELILVLHDAIPTSECVAYKRNRKWLASAAGDYAERLPLKFVPTHWLKLPPRPPEPK